MSDRTSFSELSTLARCEMQHHYSYVLRRPREQSGAAQLGTLMHAAIPVWWEQDHTAAWKAIADLARQNIGLGVDGRDTEGNLRTADILHALEQEPFLTARWLLKRYDDHYGSQRDNIKIVGTEVFAEAMIPGTSTLLKGWFDNIISVDGELWLLERKTMGDWQKLELIEVDPQITDYVWLLRAVGMPIKGVAYDAIRTYRWKRDPHPPSDSFEWLWLPRTDEQIAAGVRELEKANLRRAMLKAGLPPMRSIDKHCKWCDHRPECWGGLVMNEPEFVVEGGGGDLWEVIGD